jgi:hypothetical protein
MMLRTAGRAGRAAGAGAPAARVVLLGAPQVTRLATKSRIVGSFNPFGAVLQYFALSPCRLESGNRKNVL